MQIRACFGASDTLINEMVIFLSLSYSRPLINHWLYQKSYLCTSFFKLTYFDIMIEPLTEGSLTFLFLVSPRDDSQNRGELTGSKITYHQQFSYCGKPHCRRCREGIGHRPYWYAYQTVNGRTIRTYIGKHPPSEMQGALAPAEDARDSAIAQDFAGAAVGLYVLGQFRLEYRNHQRRGHPVADQSLQHAAVR